METTQAPAVNSECHPPTIKEVYDAIGAEIDDPEQQRLWGEFSLREQARGKGYGPVTAADMRRHVEFCRLKEQHTGLKVPEVAAVNGFYALKEADDCKNNIVTLMHYPCNLTHAFGPDTAGPQRAWNDCLWVGPDDEPLEEQCATGAHYAKLLHVGRFVNGKGRGSRLEDVSGKALL